MTTANHRATIVVSACILGAAFVAGSALRVTARPAEVRPAATPATIATVNLEAVINKLTELKDRNVEVEKRAGDLKKKLEQTTEQIKQIETELQTVIPTTDKKKRAEKLAEKLELEGLRETRLRTYQRIINLEQGAVIKDLYEKLIHVVDGVAKREGYDLVLLDDSTFKAPENASDEELGAWLRQRHVLSRGDTLDISDRVLTIMNNDYAAARGATPVSTAPTTPK